MKKVLLLSNCKEVFETTHKIAKERYELEWNTYDFFETNRGFVPNVVIMHFDNRMVRKGIFEFIIKIKGILGNTIPILALIENGTKQDIFSILKAGAYDYLENMENLQEYRKKIEEMLLWNWYLKKYRSKSCND